jgi:hypothetical protein
MTEKLIRDGLVAVAVSHGFGAGWSTWNDVDCMDARFNRLFLEGKVKEACALAKELDLGYTGGAEDVKIHWVPIGTEFRIEEYDGSESLRLKINYDWYKA